jgi:hypothetical protein
MTMVVIVLDNQIIILFTASTLEILLLGQFNHERLKPLVELQESALRLLQ